MDDKKQLIPNLEDVKLIFRDTYLLYTNFKDVQSKEEFDLMMDAARDLEKKYPFELAKKIIIDVVEVIELQWKGRNSI